MFTVTMDACVGGNPFKAWRGGTDPDDVWEAQSHDFDSLDAAKDFIRGLPEPTTTHVRLYADGEAGELIFEQDADAEHLDNAGTGVPMPHTVDSPLPFADDEVPDAPPVLPSQGASA